MKKWKQTGTVWVIMAGLLCSSVAEVTVTNLVATQRPGTKLVDISYDLFNTETNVAWVSVSAVDNGVPVKIDSLTGDAGSGVSTGAGKKIIWDMGADWSGQFSSDVVITVTGHEQRELTEMYLVIDLAGGPTAINYPVSELNELPLPLPADYKTTKLVLRRIPAGTFMMGSPTNEFGRSDNETQHQVTLTKDFYIGLFELTQKQWELVIGSNPSSNQADTHPVEMVSYEDIRGAIAGKSWPISGAVDSESFIGKLRARTGIELDLPTEARWEYACRAGTSRAYNDYTKNGGEGSDCLTTNAAVDANLDPLGWYFSNTGGTHHEAGLKQANAWGLYDMHGNVSEFCLDRNKNDLGTDSVIDPLGKSALTPNRIRRGGNWASKADQSRSASRWGVGVTLSECFSWLGFRVASDVNMSIPTGMAMIPVGNNSGIDPDSGSYSLSIAEPFYMDFTEVTKGQWDAVYSWASTNGYSFENAGAGDGTNHPVTLVNWYDCVKWCNARSEMERRMPCYSVGNEVYRSGDFGSNGSSAVSCDFRANGFRLPTNNEWEYAARGGAIGKRFPWGDTITHAQANYFSTNLYNYDISPTRGYHPDFYQFGLHTTPVKSFPANRYGLYDMIGNVWEWGWDLQSGTLSKRSQRGGSWNKDAMHSRCGTDYYYPTGYEFENHGFRSVCLANSFVSTYVSTAVDSRDYTLSVSADHGTPVPTVGTHTYAWQSAVTCSVEEVAADGWMFMGWSGDISTDYTETNRVLTLSRTNTAIVAEFSADADGDGLLNTNEQSIGTHPRMRDSDGDDFDDNFEVGQAMNPLLDNSAIRDYITANHDTFGLYASNAVLDVATGETLLNVQNGQAKLRLQMEKSDDLQSWTNAGEAIEWMMPLDGNKKFFRVRGWR